jgi:anti-sigma B factor antagonist
MEIRSKIEGNNVLVIELREDNLDASNVKEFREVVQSLIQNRSRIVFDMSFIKFVDSSGLGALISCQRLLNGRQGEFRLCAMGVTVRALFELMRMHRVFHIHVSRADALNAFDVGAHA